MSKVSLNGIWVMFRPELKRGSMYGEISYSPKMHDERGMAIIAKKVRNGVYLLTNGWYCTNEMFILVHGGDAQ